jgi:hypothetical protein
MGSLQLMNSKYSELSNKLLGSAEPNKYMLAPPLSMVKSGVLYQGSF